MLWVTKPSDIQSTDPYWSTFGMWEMEEGAFAIVRYLQDHGDAWTAAIEVEPFLMWVETQPAPRVTFSFPSPFDKFRGPSLMKAEDIKCALAHLRAYDWLDFSKDARSFTVDAEFVKRLEEKQKKPC